MLLHVQVASSRARVEDASKLASKLRRGCVGSYMPRRGCVEVASRLRRSCVEKKRAGDVIGLLGVRTAH